MLPIIRRGMERFGRHVHLRRRLPRDLGGIDIYLTPESGGLRFWKRDLQAIEPLLLNQARELIQPGMAVWDVGANVGLFTFSAASRVGRQGKVLSVEPDVDNLAGLLKSRRRIPADSNAGEVFVLPVAVSGAGARVANFHIAARSRASNALAGAGNTQMGGVKEVRSVAVLTLDELIDATFAPQVVKIDIEGAELQALKSAQRLLSEVKPTILLEASQENAQALADLLHSHGYLVMDGAIEKARRTDLPSAPWDCLAVPR